MQVVQDEDLLLALLNSAPIVDGKKVDNLPGSAGRELTQQFGGTGSQTEIAHLQRMRNALHDVIRDQADARAALDSLLRDAFLTPEVGPTGIKWELQTSSDERLAVRAAMAGPRSRSECPADFALRQHRVQLFLIDHSRPGAPSGAP